MGQRKEIGWLNFLKGIAIMAVVFDHMHKFLYQSEYLWSLSFYSVTLFTFVAGITSCLSMEKRMRLDCYDLAYTWKRLKKILIPYAVATAFYVFAKNQFFDFKTYLEALVTFSGAAPFYFIVYFVQLIVAAPLLFLVIYKIKRKSLHVLFLIGTAVFSGLCLKFTYIIKTWGGGAIFTWFNIFSDICAGNLLLEKSKCPEASKNKSIFFNCGTSRNQCVFGF